jgi:cobalt-zinc-cadmium efflux system outer membrane protein
MNSIHSSTQIEVSMQSPQRMLRTDFARRLAFAIVFFDLAIVPLSAGQTSAPSVVTVLSAASTPSIQTSASAQKVMTLKELQQMALQHNPTLAQAAANIRVAEGRKKQAGLYPNPTVGYEGEQIRGGSFRGGEQGFFIQQDIVTAGKLGLNRNVAEQDRKQTEVAAEEQKRRVLTNVKLAYIQTLAAQQTVELRENLRKLAQDAVETSHQLANVGQADAPDVLEAEVEEQKADLAVIQAEYSQQRLWNELAAVVGDPKLQTMRLDGNLEETSAISADDLVEKLVSDSTAVKIAELEVKKAETSLARAKHEPVPDLQIRAGMEENRELLDTTGRPTGLQGFAEVGVQLPVFNRNQGDVAAARAQMERAQHEVDRVKLVLRERAAGVVQSYEYARTAATRYKEQMIPRAQKAYDMYRQKYQQMGAAYPQVLIAQRNLIELQVSYIHVLESFATNSAILEAQLLTDGLSAPFGEIDGAVQNGIVMHGNAGQEKE